MTAIATARARYGRALAAAGAVLAVVLLWLGWTWFRDSSIVRVRHVQISGVGSGPDAAAIRAELRDAAGEMTTLHVKRKELEHAVSAYSIVHSVTASAKFPSTLRIEVRERVPVARLKAPDGNAVPVAADGTLLPHVPKGGLPAVGVATAPTHDGFASPRIGTLVRVLGGAPAPLRAKLSRAYLGKDGILVDLRDGTTLELGTSARLAAKWASATRVLAAPTASGAQTIDVRLPERPAARGFGTP